MPIFTALIGAAVGAVQSIFIGGGLAASLGAPLPAIRYEEAEIADKEADGEAS
jgi:hypothetical protein